jgi:hypothetical protein
MIVLVVDVKSVFPVEGEGNSPVAADRYRPSAFAVALQLMQPQSRKRHVFRSYGRVQLSQDEAQPLGLLWPDASLRARNEEALQPLMLEAPDHPASVTSCVTQIKTPNVRVQRPAAASAARLVRLPATRCWTTLHQRHLRIAHPGVDLHRMVSSARTRIVSGTLMRSSLAVLRFTTSLYLVGCSPGLAPLRILSTYAALRLNISSQSTE